MPHYFSKRFPNGELRRMSSFTFEFHESAVLFSAPRWLVPFMRWFTRRLGPKRTLNLFIWLPRLNRRRLGLTIVDPNYSIITSDCRHCLFMPPWPQWSVYRALTDLQRFGWHGFEADLGTHYRSPMIEDRYR